MSLSITIYLRLSGKEESWTLQLPRYSASATTMHTSMPYPASASLCLRAYHTCEHHCAPAGTISACGRHIMNVSIILQPSEEFVTRRPCAVRKAAEANIATLYVQVRHKKQIRTTRCVDRLCRPGRAVTCEGCSGRRNTRSSGVHSPSGLPRRWSCKGPVY